MLEIVLWIGLGVAGFGVIAIGVGVYALVSRREREYITHFREARAHQLRVKERLRRERHDS
jgi:hypothetical protein